MTPPENQRATVAEAPTNDDAGPAAETASWFDGTDSHRRSRVRLRARVRARLRARARARSCSRSCSCSCSCSCSRSGSPSRSPSRSRSRFWTITASLAALLSLTGCDRAPSSPTSPPASPSPPSPPPSLRASHPPRTLPDGRIEYTLLVRADGADILVPHSLEATAGNGKSSWSRETTATFAFDATADRFVLAPPEDGGVRREEHANAIFPGSPQEIRVPVTYEDAAPGTERFVLRFVRLGFAELAARAYVRPAKGAAGLEGEAVERTPLGERVRRVDAYRWLQGGFFLRDAPPVEEIAIEVAGP